MGLPGGGWRGREAVSAGKKGRGPAVWQRPDSWLARRNALGCHLGPKRALDRGSYCDFPANIKCCTNTKSKMANNFVMLKHSCQVINVLIVII